MEDSLARPRGLIYAIDEHIIVNILQYLRAVDLCCCAETDKTVFSRRRIRRASLWLINYVYNPFITYGSSLHYDRHKRNIPEFVTKSVMDVGVGMVNAGSAGMELVTSLASPIETTTTEVPNSPNMDNTSLDLLYTKEVKAIISALCSAQPAMGKGKAYWVSSGWVSNARKYHEALVLPDVNNNSGHQQNTNDQLRKTPNKKSKIRARRGSDALPPWPSMTHDLVCEHGALACQGNGRHIKSKRRLMRPQAWHFLRKFYPMGPIYKAHVETECVLCLNISNNVKISAEEEKERELKRRVAQIPISLLPLLHRKSGVPNHFLRDQNEAGARPNQIDSLKSVGRTGSNGGDENCFSFELSEGQDSGVEIVCSLPTTRVVLDQGGASPSRVHHDKSLPVALPSTYGEGDTSLINLQNLDESISTADSHIACSWASTVASSSPGSSYVGSSFVDTPRHWPQLSSLGDTGVDSTLHGSYYHHHEGAAKEVNQPTIKGTNPLPVVCTDDVIKREKAMSVSMFDEMVAYQLSNEIFEESLLNADPTTLHAMIDAATDGPIKEHDEGCNLSARPQRQYLSPLQPGSYFLVPRHWLVAWRAHLKHLTAPEPPPVMECTSILCKSHGLLLIPPHCEEFLEGHRRGLLNGLGGYTAQKVEIVSADEWELLQSTVLRKTQQSELSVSFCVHESGSVAWSTHVCRSCDPWSASASGSGVVSPTRILQVAGQHSRRRGSSAFSNTNSGIIYDIDRSSGNNLQHVSFTEGPSHVHARDLSHGGQKN